MANSQAGSDRSPFNLFGNIDAITARDAEFWRLLHTWRALEDEMESHPDCPDENPEVEAMLDRASEARERMFLRPVTTATAVIAKLEACEEGGAAMVLGQDLSAGVSVYQAIKWDIERLAKAEAFAE